MIKITGEEYMKALVTMKTADTEAEQEDQQPETGTCNTNIGVDFLHSFIYTFPILTGVVRIRGLPFSARENDVRQFFQPLDVRELLFARDGSGRPSGEAFITFDSVDDVEEAIKKHMCYLDRRYAMI